MTAGAVYSDFQRSALDHPQAIKSLTVPQIFGSSDPDVTRPGITGIRSSQ